MAILKVLLYSTAYIIFVALLLHCLFVIFVKRRNKINPQILVDATIESNNINEILRKFQSHGDIEDITRDIVHRYYHEILNAMNNKGLSAKGIAKLSGKPVTYINKLLLAGAGITISQMNELADYVGITIIINYKEAVDARENKHI